MAAYDIDQTSSHYEILGGDWIHRVVLYLQLLPLYHKTMENSGRTAGGLAVFQIAEAAAAQDFRGERDVDR